MWLGTVGVAGLDWSVEAGHGQAGEGWARPVWHCEPRPGKAWPGAVWPERLALTWAGSARVGKERPAWHGSVGQREATLDGVRRGRPGSVSCGRVGHDADGSA